MPKAKPRVLDLIQNPSRSRYAGGFGGVPLAAPGPPFSRGERAGTGRGTLRRRPVLVGSPRLPAARPACRQVCPSSRLRSRRRAAATLRMCERVFHVMNRRPHAGENALDGGRLCAQPDRRGSGADPGLAPRGLTRPTAPGSPRPAISAPGEADHVRLILRRRKSHAGPSARRAIDAMRYGPVPSRTAVNPFGGSVSSTLRGRRDRKAGIQDGSATRRA